MRKVKWKYLLISMAISLGAGALSTLLTVGNMKVFYPSVTQPPLAPAPIVFGIVWTVLFFLMGFSSYFVYTSHACTCRKRKALGAYALQLAVNFFWPIIFFNYGLFLLSFVWLLMLAFLVVLMILRFCKVSKAAAVLQIPYLLWIVFTAYLNLAIFVLNI